MDWVSPLVLVKNKDGKLRLCMNPKRINQVLKWEHRQVLKREDIQAELANERYFSRLDANEELHQICIDDDTLPQASIRYSVSTRSCLIHFKQNIRSFVGSSDLYWRHPCLGLQ